MRHCVSLRQTPRPELCFRTRRMLILKKATQQTLQGPPNQANESKRG